MAVIGANGAGKSTLLKSIAGLMRPRRDAIAFEDEAIGGMPTHAVAARGIALVLDGRGLFPSLTVEENLRLGGYTRATASWRACTACIPIFQFSPIADASRQARYQAASSRCWLSRAP